MPLHSLDALKRNFGGYVLGPDSEQYEAARAIWNAMIDKHPAAIARCTSQADVVAAVRFGREQGVDLSIRGGGHNIAGSALADDGLVIDLSGMKHVRIDGEARRAQVSPGATLGDFDREAQQFGLATPTGINSTTGIAGLTLGGGFGWLARRLGLTIDSLLAAEIVTADGETLTASAHENPDLFWAVRGGGGNFGVVTNFEFQLHPVGPDVLTGLVVFPLSEAGAVLRAHREFVASAPRELTVWAVLRKAPPLPFLPADVHGRDVIVLAACYAGDPASGRQALEPIRHFARPCGELIGTQPFVAWQQAFDPLLTRGARNYWKSHNFRALDDGVIDLVTASAAALPSPQCEVFAASLGGAVSDVAADATAYGMRDAQFVINVHARWETPQGDAPCIAWAREFFNASAPFATGSAYVNFMGADEGDRVAAAYASNYARLAQIKKVYDPNNVFHANQNIAPAH
jgi:FAD/FMN-containing dehydrogenase